MPPNRNNPEPPPVMTMWRAAPIVAGAAVFDFVRAFFQFFWFFGPALGALACTAGTNVVIGASVSEVAGRVVAAVCTSGAVVLGTVFSESTALFGVIVADALGLFGFLTLKMWVYSSSRRRRALKKTWLWHVGTLLFSSIPFVGAFPIYSVVLFFTFRHQIKIEKEDYRKWEKEARDARLQQRNQQAAKASQLQTAEQEELMQTQENQLAAADV